MQYRTLNLHRKWRCYFETTNAKFRRFFVRSACVFLAVTKRLHACRMYSRMYSAWLVFLIWLVAEIPVLHCETKDTRDTKDTRAKFWKFKMVEGYKIFFYFWLKWWHWNGLID